MAERRGTDENSWILIPFYADPKSVNYQSSVDRFANFLAGAKQVTGFKIAVVDDGSDLEQDLFQGSIDLLVSNPENMGKAKAIRGGLDILKRVPKNKPEFIVQYDGDGDQPFTDIPTIQERIVEVSRGNPNNPVLIIGDRYSEGLKTTPNPESVAYRQTLLMFFGGIAKQFGFEGVRDWVSGARGYTAGYAEGFLNESKSDRYGLEAEQLVIAHLIGAEVATARLSDSRQRDPWTLTSKWLQNFEVYLEHENGLRKKGQGPVVDMVTTLVNELRAGSDSFELDLAPIGEATKMQFRRWDHQAHTAIIPAEYRSRMFEEGDFPFTIKSTSSIQAS